MVFWRTLALLGWVFIMVAGAGALQGWSSTVATPSANPDVTESELTKLAPADDEPSDIPPANEARINRTPGFSGPGTEYPTGPNAKLYSDEIVTSADAPADDAGSTTNTNEQIQDPSSPAGIPR